MDFSKEQLKFLSWSSSLDLTEQEMAGLQEELKKVLTYVESLSDLPTDQVEPLISPIDQHLSNNVREDLVKQEEDIDQILFHNAPDHLARMIRVPTIIDKSTS